MYSALLYRVVLVWNGLYLAVLGCAGLYWAIQVVQLVQVIQVVKVFYVFQVIYIVRLVGVIRVVGWPDWSR